MKIAERWWGTTAARSMLSLLRCVFLAALQFPIIVGADELPGHKEFSLLSDAMAGEVLRALREKAPWKPTLDTRADSEAGIDEIWRGNVPTVEANFEELTLHFQRQGPELPLQEFFLLMQFRESQITLKSSRSGLFSTAGGLTLTSGERKIVPLSVLGSAEYRMMIALAPAPDGNFAVLLCPRRRMDSESPEASPAPEAPRIEMKDARSKLVRLTGKISGSARGKISGGFGPSVAIASLSTSSDIPRSIEYYDRAFVPNPQVGFEYKQFIGEARELLEPAESALAPLSIVTTGVEAAVDLTNAAGYRRAEVRRDVVRIREIFFPPESPVAISSLNSQGEGACYLIVKTREHELRYSKDLAPKDQLKVLPSSTAEPVLSIEAEEGVAQRE